MPLQERPKLTFLRRLRSFNICSTLMRMFYQSGGVSAGAVVVFYFVLLWSYCNKKHFSPQGLLKHSDSDY